MVPCRGRPSTLARTLEALARQQPPQGGHEVVVVADGGDPEIASVVAGCRPRFSAPLVYRSVEASGPAAARNAGADSARGEILLFLGSDTRPCEPDLLRRHVSLHSGRDGRYAVLGQIVWDDEAHPPTPLMEWLVASRIQFAFQELRPGPVPASRYLYSSHLSLEPALFREAGGFDARFREAAVEDIELGIRLEALGIELDYHPELVVAHDHPTDLHASLARARRVGRSAAALRARMPELDHPDLRIPSLGARAATPFRAPLVRVAGRWPLPTAARERLWHALHSIAYARGHAEGRRSA